MCTNPMWRIPVKKYVFEYLFKQSERGGYNEVNQAFFIPQSNFVRANAILSTLERSPKAYDYAKSNMSTNGCGRCLECKIKDSKQWAQRSVAESLMHVHNYFITLTYDDEHLPVPVPTYARHNYEFGLWSPLLYDDFEDFKKRLIEHMRYHFNIDGIRFFMCGEYGPKSGRPHFHCIFYGLPLPDVQKHCDVTVGGKKYVYLTSKTIEDKWGKGFVTLGDVNWETSAYVARYVMKKFSNLEEFDYSNLCYSNGWQPLPPEMRQSSRNPGLGKPFYEAHKDEIYPLDKVVLPNGNVVQPCSYFDSLYDLEEPDILECLKNQRVSNAILAQQNEQSKFKNSTEYSEYKKKKSDKFARSISKLKRPL